MCWQIFKPFIDLLKWNLRLVRPKNGFSNFFDFLCLAWLSRYKITIEIDIFHQWRKTSGCGARDVQVWRSESEFRWWQTDRQTDWQPKCLALTHTYTCGETNKSITLLRHWQLCQALVRHFWKRWSAKYLTTVNRLSKWRYPTRNVEVGDVVLLRKDKTGPTQWPLARVTSVY